MKLRKKKNLSWEWEVDWKSHPSQSQSGITRQASWHSLPHDPQDRFFYLPTHTHDRSLYNLSFSGHVILYACKHGYKCLLQNMQVRLLKFYFNYTDIVFTAEYSCGSTQFQNIAKLKGNLFQIKKQNKKQNKKKQKKTTKKQVPLKP